MTQFHKIKTAAAILGTTALMSTGALAMSHSDATCGDFNAMSADDQMAMAMEMQGPEGGREEAREDAIETDGDAANDAVSTSGDAIDTDGGREEAREEMRGDDMVTAMTEHCKGGDDLMIKDMRHPSE